MSKNKKKIRDDFRAAVMKRDGHKCRICKWNAEPELLDAHHITDRNEMPAGGYVAENGIALCPLCHMKAELWHSTGATLPPYEPDDLYNAIGSSYDKAVAASRRLEEKLARG